MAVFILCMDIGAGSDQGSNNFGTSFPGGIAQRNRGRFSLCVGICAGFKQDFYDFPMISPVNKVQRCVSVFIFCLNRLRQRPTTLEQFHSNCSWQRRVAVCCCLWRFPSQSPHCWLAEFGQLQDNLSSRRAELFYRTYSCVDVCFAADHGFDCLDVVLTGGVQQLHHFLSFSLFALVL